MKTETLFGLGQPVGPSPFRYDHDADVRSVTELLGEAKEKRGIMLETQGARVKQAQLVGKAILARPRVILRSRRQLADRRPILDEVKHVPGHAPVREYRQEILGDYNYGVAAPGQPPFKTFVTAPNEMPEDRKAAAHDSFDGDPIEILDPEYKAHAESEAAILQDGHGVERGGGSDDHVGLPGLDPRRQ